MNKIPTGQPLTMWSRENQSHKTLLWKEAKSDQICFVRDQLSLIIAVDHADYKRLTGTSGADFSDGDGVTAISTHMSKSCLLPVYLIDSPARGWQVVVRNNFYDWKLSIISHDGPITSDVLFAVPRRERINPVYCEGFKEEWVFGTYAENPREFTVELHDQFMVWSFFWELCGRKYPAEQYAK